MFRRLMLSVLAVVAFAGTASAHFQEILPSADVLPEGGKVEIDLVFTHPMAGGPTMEMAKPKRFGVKVGGKTVNLLDKLADKKVGGKQAWTASYELKEPGAALFFVEPQPYFEPAEKKYIIHYSKVLVDSFASGEDWDAMVGFPVEIKPLVRPTGVWTGNLFRGVVMKGGKPVPNAEVEVEWVNDGSVKPANDAFLTQVIKADQSGVFSYAMPRAGWWGFAALVDGDKANGPKGEPVGTELGALIWVRATDMK